VDPVYSHATEYTRFSPASPFSSTSCSSANRISPALSVSSFSSDDTMISPPQAWSATRDARITPLPKSQSTLFALSITARFPLKLGISVGDRPRYPYDRVNQYDLDCLGTLLPRPLRLATVPAVDEPVAYPGHLHHRAEPLGALEALVIV